MPRRIGKLDVLEALEKMIESLQNDFEQSFNEFGKFGNESKPLMYGFLMDMDPNGEPIIKTFGDKAFNSGFREPVYDQFVKVDTDELIVTIEIPGITKEDIELKVTESNIVVTSNCERKYKSCIDLKVPVVPENAKAACRNGILTVTLNVKGKSNKGLKINVE